MLDAIGVMIRVLNIVMRPYAQHLVGVMASKFGLCVLVNLVATRLRITAVIRGDTRRAIHHRIAEI